MYRVAASTRVPLLLCAALLLWPGASDSSLRTPFDERRVEELQEAGLVARRAARPADLGSPPRDALAAGAAAAAAAGSRSTRVSPDLLEPDGGTAEREAQAEPFLAIDPERESHLLAGFQEGRYPTGAARAVSFAVSFDGGRHWAAGLLPGLTGDSGGRYERATDPWVAFGPGGRAYYASIGLSANGENGVFVSSSADGGLTWDAPVAVRAETRNPGDKEAMTVDTRTDSPYRGRVYVAWHTQTAEQRTRVRLAYSDDEASSFTAPVTIYDQDANIGVIPLVGPHGLLHAVWATYVIADGVPVPRLLSARSTDGGDSWSEPVEIAVPHPAGVPGSRTANGLPSAAIDARNGNLYVVWQDQRFSPGIDQVVLARSTDGGLHWSAPQLVSDGPRNAANFTPAVTVNANGVVGIAYYTLRNDPARSALVDEYLAISRDGGRRFRSTRVSGASWDLRFAATSSDGYFLGDYQGLAASRLMFFPLWIGTFDPSSEDPTRRQADVFTRAMKAR